MDRAGMDGTHQQRNDLLDTDLQKKIASLHNDFLVYSLNLSKSVVFCLSILFEVLHELHNVRVLFESLNVGSVKYLSNLSSLYYA